jgi:hypothetical protein
MPSYRGDQHRRSWDPRRELRRSRPPGWPPLLLCFLLGCSATTSSRNVRTGGLVALIDVTSEQPQQAVVAAGVVVGGHHSNTHVVLEDGDRLVASCEDEQHDMLSVGNGSYEARFGRGEGEFVVSLVREVDATAPRSVGRLPVAFEITSNFPDTPISRTHDPLTVSWSPGGTDAEVSIEIEGDCIHSADLQVAGNPGTFVIEPGKLGAWKNQDKEACNVALRLVQTRRGQADPALAAHSSVVLRQIRATRFVSGP